MAKRWHALHRRRHGANRHHHEPAYIRAWQWFDDYDDGYDYYDGDPFEDDDWDDDWDDDEPETWGY